MTFDMCADHSPGPVLMMVTDIWHNSVKIHLNLLNAFSLKHKVPGKYTKYGSLDLEKGLILKISLKCPLDW